MYIGGHLVNADLSTMTISTSSDIDKLNSETEAAELVNAFNWDGNGLEPGLAIALSGGGFRAMLFHAGALLRLNELGLLSRAGAEAFRVQVPAWPFPQASLE